MSGDHRSYKDQILNAIEDGTLSHEESERRLQELIDSEINRKDGPADMELIDACQSLLWILSNTPQPVALHTEQSLASLQMRLAKRKQRQRVAVITTRAIAIAAIFLVLFVGVGGLLRWEWFSRYSTPDEQQYVIQGYVIDPQIIARSIAEHIDNVRLETKDYSEVLTFLGFDPCIPQHLVDHWDARNFFVSITPDMIYISTLYLNNDGNARQLTLDSFFCTSVENAYITFEQNQTGKIEMVNDYPVYVSENEGYSVACWLRKNLVLMLSSEGNYSELRTILVSEIGGM